MDLEKAIDTVDDVEDVFIMYGMESKQLRVLWIFVMLGVVFFKGKKRLHEFQFGYPSMKLLSRTSARQA